MEDPVRDYIRPGLKVLFVGFNPGFASGVTGHHYAGKNNAFWRLLEDSGLAPGLDASTGHRILEHDMGLTNVVPRPTREASEVRPEERRSGAKSLREKIAAACPLIVCYTGKGAFSWASSMPATKVQYGRQAERITPPAIDFVVPSPSGRSTMPYPVKLSFYRQLKQLLEEVGTRE